MRIVFLGTPDFAVASLKALIENGFNIVAVVTAPDRPAGRGMQLQASPVKRFAVLHNIPVLQPHKLRDPAFIEELKGFHADLQVVIAFRMLPEAVWSMPAKGTVNLHASLLPDYRGAAPINRAIMNGETETGVSTFLLKHEIDTGDILFSARTPVPPDMNAGQLHDILMETGAELIVRTVAALEKGEVKGTPQTHESDKKAPKIFTEDCRIDWSADGKKIYDQIRGLSPYPCAFTSFEGKNMKVFSARFITETQANLPGTIATDHRSFLHFACNNGWIGLEEIQPEGKKKMGIRDYFNGYRNPNNH